MPTHWTYDTFKPEDDLQQGDILTLTDGLRDVFGEVHPHFLDPKYLAFLVLTQSCDLVRRDGERKSRYVNLAVVRSLDSVLSSFLDIVCERVADRVYVAESRPKAEQLLARVFNQNEQALGIFYLHQDADAGIAEPAVGLLQVSIAVRTREHYEILRNARRGRLCREFQSRLGWLVGNLFSRVATKDWDTKAVHKMVNDYLEGETGRDHLVWVPRAAVRSAKKNGCQLEGLAQEKALGLLSKYEPSPPSETAIDRVVHHVREVLPKVADAGRLHLIEQRLRNDATFRNLFVDRGD